MIKIEVKKTVKTQDEINWEVRSTQSRIIGLYEGFLSMITDGFFENDNPEFIKNKAAEILAAGKNAWEETREIKVVSE